MPAPKDPIKRAQWIEKQRVSHQGKRSSKETMEKMHTSAKKRYEDLEERMRSSASAKKRWEDSEERKKQKVLMKEVMNRLEVREKLSAFMRGENNPSKRPEVKEKMSSSIKKLWQDPGYVSKQMIARGVSPNKPEKFLYEVFQRLFPNQIRYTGDGKDENFIIAGKCPDFTFTDGQKKIIEFFGGWWHGEGRTGVPNEQHEQERIDLFAKHGYQTLVIWEHELENIGTLQDRLLVFTEEEEREE